MAYIAKDLRERFSEVAQLDLLCIIGGMGCWYFAKENLGEAARNWPFTPLQSNCKANVSM